MNPGQRWCHACCALETFNGGWYEVWMDTDGRFVAQPVSDPHDYHKQFRGDTFACGEGSALVLFERYLQSRTFAPSVHPQATSTATANDAFAELT